MLARTRCMLLFVVGLMALLGMGCAASPTSQAAAAPASRVGADVVFVIPNGTEAALERGDPAFQFPDKIDVEVGSSVVITNQDYAMHYFFDIPVAPGQTIRKPFPRRGEFVYQGGLSCSISRSNTIKVQVV